MKRLVFACLVATRLTAADAAAVADVDGRTVTLRQVEDALLKKEGAELVQDFLSNRLENLDWASLADEDLLIQVGQVKLTRRQLADILLQHKGAGQVREELVQIAMVDRALEREGVVVTDPVLDAALLRLERRFQQDSAAKLPAGQRVDFASYLRSTKRMTLPQFRASQAFRMLAGIQALVISRARRTVTDAELATLFNKDPERFRAKAAADLQVLFMPWRTEPGPDGKPLVSQAERERLGTVASAIFGQIVRNEQTFERAWGAFGKTWDPEAGEGGRTGWVTREGTRLQPGSRPIPPGVMAEAWNVDKGFPVLLPPQSSDEGVWILRMLGRRPERAPDLATMRDDVFNALVEDTMEARTAALLDDLRRTTPVTYLSLPGAVQQQAAPAP